jgi:PAS domain S-box-containing protein
MLGPQERPRDPRRGRSTAPRDLLVIALAAVTVFFLGVHTGVFRASHDWLMTRAPAQAADVFGLLMLLVGVGAVYGIRRARQAGREKGLRAETERRLRTVVEQVPAVTYAGHSMNMAGKTSASYVSPQIQRLLGYTSAEWATDPELWVRSIHPDDRPRVLAAWQLADGTGSDFHEEYRSITKDGRVVWIRDEAVVVARDHQGHPLRVQGVMFDVTEQREAQEDLRATEERYRILVEHLPVAVYTDAVDDVSTAVYISPQYERITGYSAEQRMAEPELWVSMLHPDDRDRVLAESRVWVLKKNEPTRPGAIGDCGLGV